MSDQGQMAAEPQQAPRIEVWADRAHNHNARLDSMRERLESFCNGLEGQEPPSTGEIAKLGRDDAPEGALLRYDQALERQDDSLCQLEYAVNRLMRTNLVQL